MKKEKNKTTGKTVIIIILAVLLLSLVIYICYDKQLFFNSKDKTVEQKKDSNKEESNSSKDNITDLKIDNDKCLNCQGKEVYYIVSSYDHIEEVKAYFSTEDSKKGNVSIDIDEYNKKAGSNYSLSNPSLKYNFDKEIRNVVVSNIGQEEYAPIIVFLMNDGTLNYIDIYNGLENNDLSTYKKINNVSNIINLYQASACSKEYCSIRTILAQKEDGSFYDLSSIVYNN